MALIILANCVLAFATGFLIVRAVILTRRYRQQQKVPGLTRRFDPEGNKQLGRPGDPKEPRTMTQEMGEFGKAVDEFRRATTQEAKKQFAAALKFARRKWGRHGHESPRPFS